jgi:DNA mismatch repair protein MutS
VPGAVPDSTDTPLMRQYLEVKDRYPDCIVFFRLGDFYEMFFDDAVVVARTLDLTLTTRDKGKENPIPMCGVPHHASRHYLAKLVEHGFKVAICEQVEDPKAARGIVKREVVRVVTPGVILDEEQLDAKAPHYLVAVIVDGDAAGIAHLDVTTGEFAATQLGGNDLVDELARLEPREVLTSGLDPEPLKKRVRSAWAELPPEAPTDGERARALIEETLGRAIGTSIEPSKRLGTASAQAAHLAPLGSSSEFGPLALRAGAAVLAYARATQPRGALPVTHLRAYRPGESLILDEATRANLELFATLQGSKKQGSLLAVIDETRTAMGGRLIRRWLAAPLTDVAQIRRRHDAVEWLVEHAALRGELRGELAEVYDLERLAGRVTLGVATPRDLAALKRSLERLVPVRARLSEAFSHKRERLVHPELLELGLGPRPQAGAASEASDNDLAEDVRDAISRVLVDEPPASWREGSFCRRGFSPELDELVDLAEGGKNKLAEIEARERERTGIGSLKIRYNRVFGYYLEITRSNLDRVPADYVRKQTLANAERFVTPELAEYEARILHADERRLTLELEAFERLRAEVARAAPRLLALAEAVARLDALAGLAEVAHVSGYQRPVVDDGLVLEIEDGRHPVVERLAAAGKFVPNDTRLDPDSVQLVILTGPNMAGKSTAMRQVALTTVLAQMGSFVPARRARIGVVDRVFTRVGASDNLARGDSTFMVEMRETAHILSHATRRSLVVLDEIGRGTSTYDGMAIAWAVAEHLHDRIGCRAMFATHYHELTALAQARPRVRNFSTAVREWKDEVVFLHKVVEGGASRSYGIQVARLAGLDRTVIARARTLLEALERGETLGHKAEPPQLSLPVPVAAAAPSEVERLLRALDIDGITPREALAVLADLQARLQR